MATEKLQINSDLCIGCWACAAIAEDLIEIWDHGKAQVKKQPETQEELDTAKDAKDSCPVDSEEGPILVDE